MNKLQIVVTLSQNPDGTAQLSITGAIKDKVLAYEMLAQAMVQVRDYHIQQQQQRIVTPNFIFPEGRD